MSLFDVIRYPVSCPPTFDQLNAIPTNLYRYWITRSSWSDVDTQSSWDPLWVAQWMRNNTGLSGCRINIEYDIRILRKIIEEAEV